MDDHARPHAALRALVAVTVGVLVGASVLTGWVPPLTPAAALGAPAVTGSAPDDEPDSILPGPLTGSDDPLAPAALQAGSVQGVLSPDGEPGSTRYYRYQRVLPDSTVHLGVILPTTAGSHGVRVGVATDDGTTCEQGSATRVSSSAGVAGVHLVVSGADPDDPDPSSTEVACASASALEITVQPGYADRGGASTRFALRIVEEPAVVGTAGLPAGEEQDEYEPPTAEGDPEPVVPGTFAQAPVVATGVYTTTVTIGGPDVVLAVPLAWGQGVAARIAVRPYTGPGAEEVGSVGPQLALGVLDPLLAPVSPAVDRLTVSTANTGYAETTAGPVRWRDRVDGDGPVLAGVHYLVVSPPGARSVDEPLEDDGLEVPVGLVLEVRGEPSGEPGYRGDAEVVGGGSGLPGAESVSESDRGAVGADTGGPGPGRWALLVVLALVGLGSVTAGVRLLRR